MKQTNVSLLIILVLSACFLVTLLSLPQIDVVEADPYLHVNNTPLIYWISFCLTISVTLLVALSKKFGSGRYGLGFFSAMLSAVYVYVIPKLFYVNPIYTDTYIFVTELISALTTGHVGWGHSVATPGLAIFASQFSLLTGIEHILVAELVALLIPMLTIFFVCVAARFIIGKRASLLACLLYMSVNWMGFAFNRQSFALVLQVFVIYTVFKIYSSERVSLSWYIVSILSYIASVFIHPLSSLFILITPISVVVLFFLLLQVRRIRHITIKDRISNKNVLIKTSILSVIFSAIWLAWNLSVDVNFYYLVQSLTDAVQGLFVTINPAEHTETIIPTYTEDYLPIINLRMYMLIFEAIAGTVLAFFVLLKNKTNWKLVITSLWFILWMSMAVFGLYGNWLQLLYRPFLYSFPIFAFILAWFIVQRTDLQNRRNKIRNVVVTAISGLFLVCSLFLLLTVPLTMYTNASIMYPPSAYLEELDYVTVNGQGNVAILYSSSELEYYTLLNNASANFIWFHSTANITKYECIVTTFRAYTKGAFTVSDLTLAQDIQELETNILTNSSVPYAKVYDSDSWHQVYVKQLDN